MKTKVIELLSLFAHCNWLWLLWYCLPIYVGNVFFLFFYRILWIYFISCETSFRLAAVSITAVLKTQCMAVRTLRKQQFSCLFFLIQNSINFCLPSKLINNKKSDQLFCDVSAHLQCSMIFVSSRTDNIVHLHTMSMNKLCVTWQTQILNRFVNKILVWNAF